jgi:hypothetical protein
MPSDDWFLLLFLSALFGSVLTSIYLWFFREVRSGVWIWFSYMVRAVCGSFVFGAGIIAWDLLADEIALNAVIPFVGPFFLVGLICLVPWGLWKRTCATS